MTVMEVDYDPGLVEATVLHASRDRGVERMFRRERDRLYEIADPEEREAAFAALHGCWFQRLGLDQPLRDALGEQPGIAARCPRGIVGRALGPGDEHADLLVTAAAPPTVLIRVTPKTLSARDQTLGFLRSELFHIADMLDPEFGYEPSLGDGPAGSPLERRRRDRYRVLWAAFIDGRLARRGRAAPDARSRRWHDFQQAFRDLGPAAEAAFERFWSAEQCTHAELAACAAGTSGATAGKEL
jgi:hypothetical protein